MSVDPSHPAAHRRHLSTVVQALVALSLATTLGLVAAPTAGAAPTEAPSGLSATGSPVPTLTWDEVPGATRYLVQGSPTDDFSSSVRTFSETTVNTTYVPVVTPDFGTLHWRVQAQDSSGDGPWGTAETTAVAPDPPSGLEIERGSPGDTVQPPASPPVIHWDAVAGATGYDVWMDTEGDGIGGTVKTVDTTDYVWPDLQGTGDYFVQVRARFANGMQSEWSDQVSYDVAPLPAVTAAGCEEATACAPAPGASDPRPLVTLEDVVLDWDPVKGAARYELRIALDPDFNNTSNIEERTVLGTRYSPPTTYDNNAYYWQVRAIDASGQAAPWPAEPSIFQRRWPDQPDLVHPAPQAEVGDDVYYQWTPVQHASRYELQVSTDANFTPTKVETCETAGTTYTPGHRASDACMPQQGALTYWRVRALDAPRSVQGIFSSSREFIYSSGTVQRTSPLDGAAGVTVPTLRWQPSQDAVRYSVELKDASGSVVDSETTYALSWTPMRELDPADGPFSWTVSAIDADGRTSPRAAARTFSLADGPLPGGDDPLAPVTAGTEPTSSRVPALVWQPLAGADHYRLHVSEAPGYELDPAESEVLRARLPYPAVTPHDTRFLSSRTRTWWVTAHGEDGKILPSGTGDPATFEVSEPAAVQGQQAALDGVALDAGTTCSSRFVVDDPTSVCTGLTATPVLDWEPVAGAGGYMLYLAEDPDFTNLVAAPTSLITTNSRWAPRSDLLTALPDNESGDAYYWFVRPCVDVRPLRNCGPDPESLTDAATNAFRKVSPAVQLIAPTDGATFSDEVTLSWEDYVTTNAAVRMTGSEHPSHQTAMSYRVQVARTAQVTDGNAIDDVVVDQATYTAFRDTYPEGDLWWRVQAIDGKGNRLAWSQTRHMVKRSATPSLDLTAAAHEEPHRSSVTSPAYDGRVAADDVLLRWPTRDFDATWQVEVYKNDDTTLSTGNRVISTSTKQAALVPATPLPPSDRAYVWRVRRIDGGQEPGAWSDLGRFFVDPASVTLDGPADGGQADPDRVVLRWRPLNGDGAATRYRVSTTSPSGSTSTISTYATAYAPTKAWQGGTWRWSVTALDTDGQPIGSSEARTLEVDPGLRATTAPVIEGVPSVGQTITGTPPEWNHRGVSVSYQWLRDGSTISGARSSSYTLTTADFSRQVSLRVTGQRAGYSDGVVVSEPVTVTEGEVIVSTSPPIVSGTPVAGSRLSTTPGTWSQSSARYTYQWLRDGTPIGGATSSSYRLEPTDAGRRIGVEVTAQRTGYASGSARSEMVQVDKLTSTTSSQLSNKRIRRGKSVRVSVTVDVPDVAAPVGRVRILDGRRTVKTVTLTTARAGDLTVRLRKLKAGKHQISARYLGNESTMGSSSRRTRLVVRR